jgi:hypothetical protein
MARKRRAADRRHRSSLVAGCRGGTEFIEKLILIGLFAVVLMIAVRYIAGSVHRKFMEQGDTIEQLEPGPLSG